MSKLGVIQINDAGLTCASAGGLEFISPGYAVFDGTTLYTGAEAWARARLNPRRSYDRFWSQLDQQPLQRPAGDAHSHADLAYFHLRDLCQNLDGEIDEVIFAVPGDFGKERLALLLGIAQALEMPVTGLVASEVAAAAAVGGDAPRLVLDAELHRLTATQVSGGDRLKLGDKRELARQGIAKLYIAWAEMIAERFVQEARYDPMHQAAAEQTLYQQLPGWLAEMHGRESARFELQVDQRSHHVDISSARLRQAAKAFYQPVIEAAAAASAATVLLGYQLAHLPGLVSALTERLGVQPVALEPASVARSIFEHIEAVRTDAAAPAFVTHLPGAIAAAVTPPPVAREATSQAVPTHLLHNWHAYPINGAPLVLDGAAPRGLRLGETPSGAMITMQAGQAMLEPGKARSLRLNGQQLTSAAQLAVGDSLSLGDSPELRLIKLIAGDETA